MPTRAHNPPKQGLTDRRRAQAIEQMEKTGLYEDAAKAAGVTRKTLHQWRKAHPEFEQELSEAREAKTIRIGCKARDVLEMYFDAYRAGKRVIRKRGQVVQKTGKTVQVTDNDPTPLDMSAVRTALGRMDPRWVQMPKDAGNALTAEALEQGVAEAERITTEVATDRSEMVLTSAQRSPKGVVLAHRGKQRPRGTDQGAGTL